MQKRLLLAAWAFLFLAVICPVNAQISKANWQPATDNSDESTLVRETLSDTPIGIPVNLSDSLALVALYNDCGGSAWTKKTNWLTGHVETWEGVTVEIDRVVELWLEDWGTSVGLTGMLPAVLGNMSELRALSLANNDLFGPVPDSWMALTKLRHLNLAGNHFSGVLPDSWSGMEELRNLILYSNELSGSLPASWSALIYLEEFTAYNNQFTGSLPDSWSAMVNMKGIILFNNQISGSLPATWSSMAALTNLALNSNLLTGTLPAAWSAMVSLNSLNLGANQISGGLPTSWSALTNVTYMDFWANQLSGSLPDSWSALVNLNLLQFSGNQLSGTLPDSWSALVNLTFFNVGGNQFSGEVPASWTSWVNLETFTISGNQFSGFPGLTSMTKLNTLEVNQNKLDFGDIEPNIGIPKVSFSYGEQANIGETATVIRNAGAEFKITLAVGGTSNVYAWYKDGTLIPTATTSEFKIPAVVASDNGQYTCTITNTVATDLSLYTNPITLEVLTPINSTDSLALVTLYNDCGGSAWTKKTNWLTGHVETWEGVKVEGDRVVELWLEDWGTSVGLTGTLPGTLSNLKELQVLSLANNELSGSVPEAYSLFTKLRHLNLGGNHFSGALPASWAGMVEMRNLMLHENQFSGSLPASWSALTNLEEFHLYNNLFTGSLPDSWSSMVNLKGLTLFNNQLSGTLPASWSAMVNLTGLNFGGNQLTGTLPGSWSSMVSLTAVDFAGSQITGSLPASWSSLTNLEYLDFGNNQLSGSLPAGYSALTKLKRIYLYGNQLSGDVPSEYTGLANLEELILDNNQLTGLPNLSPLTKMMKIQVPNNKLDFGDIEPNVGVPSSLFVYSPQASIGTPYTVTKSLGEELSLLVTCGGTSNQYKWFKNGDLISGATSNPYVKPSMIAGDAGVYTCQVFNTVATNLVLTSEPITVTLVNSNADISDFVVNYSDCGCGLGTSIDPILNRILVKVPYTMDISNLAPSLVSIDPGAFITPDPTVPQNWNLGPVEYTVTASDGVTVKHWSVKVQNPPCQDTNVYSWIFNNDVEAFTSVVSAGYGTITAKLKPGTDLTNLNGAVSLGCGSVMTNLAGELLPASLDFSVVNPQKFRVTAQDGAVSRIWTVIVTIADLTPPTVTTWSVIAYNCTDSVAVQSNEPGRVYIVHQDAINMSAAGGPTPLYNLADLTGTGATSVNRLLANRLGSYSIVATPGAPVYVKTNGLYMGTYWAFAVDNAGNVSQISPVSITLDVCEVEVSTLCDLRNQPNIWRYFLTQEVYVTYEETRVGGNWKFVQTASCGILIEDRYAALPASYGEGAGLTGLKGYLDNSGNMLKFIPLSSYTPTISSSGNTVSPISISYLDFINACYLPSFRSYESMLVKVTTPFKASNDYGQGLNWVYDNLDLKTTIASGRSDYIIQSVFNSSLIGQPIPTTPYFYQGIRTNVTWAPSIYGMITPRSTSDYSPAVNPQIGVSTSTVTISDIKPGTCGSLNISLYNDGAGTLSVTELNVTVASGSGEINLLGAPTLPITIASWGTQSLTIQFCPVNDGNETATLGIVSNGGNATVNITGTTYVPVINDIPYCQSFNPPWPSASMMGSLYEGWVSPPTNATDLQNYVSNAWVNFDGSMVMNMRARKIVGGVRQPTFLITPGIQVNGSDPVISWAETASTNAWVGLPKISPRNLYISTNGIDWTLVDSYTTATMPDAWTGGGWRTKQYSLAPYIGQTIWWKFELISSLTANGYEYTYWCLDNICFSERITGPVIASSGDGVFGTSMMPVDRYVNLSNIGLSLLRIKSFEIVGDPEFSVSTVAGTPPLDLKGSGSAWSEYDLLDMLRLVVRFNPVGSKASTATLKITYGTAVEKVLEIPLSGTGTDAVCSGAGIALAGRNWAPGQNTWFKYTSPSDQIVQITSCDINQKIIGTEYAWDTYLMVYSDCNGTLLAVNDDSETGCSYNRASSTVILGMTAGQTVYIAWPLLFENSMHYDEGFYFNITAATRIDGDICETAIPLTLPVVDLSGSTAGFSDDYNQSPCFPQDNYMDGNDVVYQIEILYPGTLSGSISGVYSSVSVLNTCPSVVLDPSACIGFAAGPNGGSFSNHILPGTYYVIVSSWAPPQSIDYILNLQYLRDKHHMPDWTVDPQAFDFDGEITAQVFIDDVPVEGGLGVLGAFVGNECRGVKKGGLWSPQSKYVFIMRCYSNLTSGENLSFRYYDPGMDTVYGVRETIAFEANMTVGDAINPTALHVYNTVIVERDLSKGWSWFSVNVDNADMALSKVLGSLKPTNGDYIKSQTASASWYDGLGWFGELEVIDPRQMYKIKLAKADKLTYEGNWIDPSTMSIAIKQGWNWIGFIPKMVLNVSHAMSSINPQASDYIKNQTTSSTNYNEFGWFGELGFMGPLEGYMLRSTQAATLTYPNGWITMEGKNGKNEKNEKNVKSVKNVKNVKNGGLVENNPVTCHSSLVTLLDPITGKSTLIPDYEYSGQVTATVFLNGENYAGEDYCLYSVVEGRVRGVSRGMWFEPTKQWIHNHLTYSVFSEGDTIRFRLHDKRTDTWYRFEEYVVFKADMVIANAIDPFVLKTSSLLEPYTLSLESSLDVFPNPTSYLATIKYSITTDQPVLIQVIDYTGRVVGEFDQGRQQAGAHQFSWDTWNLEQGVYYLRIKDSDIGYRKVVVTR